jgi:hypothetical protein
VDRPFRNIGAVPLNDELRISRSDAENRVVTGNAHARIPTGQTALRALVLFILLH